MRSLRVLVATAVALCGISAASYAAFKTIGTPNTFTATTQFEGDGNVTVNATIVGGANIAWNATNITLGTTKWKAADSYIRLESQITAATGGIQIYTNNTAYTGTGNPAGLVNLSSTTMAPLTMCWRIVDESTGALKIVQGSDNNLYAEDYGGDVIDGSGKHIGYPCFLWMKDKNTKADSATKTTAFSNGDDYMTVKDAARGIHHAGGDWGGAPSPDYIYIGADFSKAVTPTTYSATIVLEAFTE